MRTGPALERVKPNALDRVISYFSPAAGFRRQRFREASAIRQSYDAAKSGRRGANWTATGASANVEISASISTMRERSRDLIRNNPLARNSQGKWADSTVGAGVLCRWQDKRLQEKWDEWTKLCSADGLAHFEAIQYLAAMAEFESGEVLLRIRPRRKSDGVWPPFQIQILESDYLDNTKTGPVDGGYCINGVEFNAIGKRVAYWLWEQHPGDAYSVGFRNSVSTNSKRVPAREIAHIFQATRPGQVRGVPRIAVATQPARDTADWEEAEILRKRTEACIAAAVTSPEGDDFRFTAEVEDANGNQVSTMEPGMLLKLKPGEDVSWNNPTYAGGYDEYKVSRQRDIAAGVQVPFELATGNYSKSNYSSSRMGAVAFKRTVNAFQWNVLIPLACEFVAQEFLRQLAIYENVTTDTSRKWTPPAFELLDRAAEAKADQIELQTGKTSWPQMVSASGEDPEQQIAEIERYAERLRAAGIDFFQGQLLAAETNNNGQQAGNEPTL